MRTTNKWNGYIVRLCNIFFYHIFLSLRKRQHLSLTGDITIFSGNLKTSAKGRPYIYTGIKNRIIPYTNKISVESIRCVEPNAFKSSSTYGNYLMIKGNIRLKYKESIE